MELTCFHCSKNFERKKIDKKSKRYFCSTKCLSAQKSIDQSDEYTMFRYMFKKARQRSVRYGREFSITLDDLKNIWELQKGCCNLTGVPLVFGETLYDKEHGGTTASLDRKDSRLGYTLDNIQIIHKKIQDLKSDWDQKELISFSYLITSHCGQCVDVEFAIQALDSFPSIGYNVPVVDDDPNFVAF